LGFERPLEVAGDEIYSIRHSSEPVWQFVVALDRVSPETSLFGGRRMEAVKSRDVIE
jgi:hypothetical protein